MFNCACFVFSIFLNSDDSWNHHHFIRVTFELDSLITKITKTLQENNLNLKKLSLRFEKFNFLKKLSFKQRCHDHPTMKQLCQKPQQQQIKTSQLSKIPRLPALLCLIVGRGRGKGG